MSNRYVPGASHPYFPKHQYFGVKLGGNMYPLSQGKLAYHADSAARARKAIETEMLTAEHLWATFQKEAEAVVLVDGRPLGDVEERNRRINAAYAKLWLADHRFQWAGLAAFASKQVGCGLLHAGGLAKKQNDELRYASLSAGNSAEAAAASAISTTIRNGANFMHERLGYGNMHLFLDISPCTAFTWNGDGRNLKKVSSAGDSLEARCIGTTRIGSSSSGSPLGKFSEASGRLKPETSITVSNPLHSMSK